MIKPKQKSLLQKLKRKYRLVILSEENLEERASFSLSRVNVVLVTSLVVLLVSIGVYFLIAHTSLREYIPGYADFDTRNEFTENAHIIDSLVRSIDQQYEKNQILNNILSGNVDEYSKERYRSKDSVSVKEGTKPLQKSKEDSLLRAEFEKDESFNVFFDEEVNVDKNIKNILFFPPVRGIITEKFSTIGGHPAVDIASSPNAGIKAVLEGTVIYSDWNVNTGYSVIIQHKKNLISVYKHNSVLLKKIGNFVQAGETIAIIGESGELSHGPHLHFELWYDGNPVDPEKYIAF